MRRLPVYLLLDCSESMIGEGIAAVQRGMESLVRTLRTDPHALETVWLSCITFSREAHLEFPLTELTEVQLPRLSVRPGTSLGGALNLCLDQIKKEVHRSTPQQKGDWRPLIIVITDGHPTDNLHSAIQRIQASVKPSPANIYAIGCGDDVDFSVLQQISEIVLHLPNMTDDSFKKLFVWLTASVTEGSHGIHEPLDNQGIDLSKLPSDAIQKIDIHKVPTKSAFQRQVFLYARCAFQQKPYLMRFKWNDESREYNGTLSHKLDFDERSSGSSKGFEWPSINSESLVGIPPCPHCDAPGAARCDSCGGLLCSDLDTPEVQCPHCNTQLDSFNGPCRFNLDQSMG